MSKSTREARKEAQDRLAAERAAQKATDRRRSIVLGVVVVVIVGVIAALVAVTLINQDKATKDVGALPAGVSADNGYGLTLGATSGDVAVLDLFEDFQCPACKGFEKTNGDTIRALQDDKTIKVNYRPLSFLDGNLSNTSSARAANAFGCASDQGKASEYHEILFANQPAEKAGTEGFTDDQLVDFGKKAGITSPDFATCVNDNTYAKWVNAVQVDGNNRPITSTPTILIDGKKVEPTTWSDAAAFKKALQTAIDGNKS